MWGKVPFHRSRNPSGENHLSKDTRVSPSPPSVVHNRKLSAKALPSLPSDPPNFHSTAHHRVASSVYSRDTAVFDHHSQRSISDTYQFPPQLHSPSSAGSHPQGTRSVDISPPDSPISRIHSPGSSRVSSIEEEPTQFTDTGGSGGKSSSHIPILRKRVDSLPDRQAPKPLPRARANTTRWDDFSGEPTTSTRGRIGQVASSGVFSETHVSAPRRPSTSSKLLDWGKEQLQSRRKAPESRNIYYDEATPFAPREPWRGQSGRAAMINPIQEKPRARSSSRLRLLMSNDQPREMSTPSPVLGVGSGTVTTTITAGEPNFQPQPRTKPYDARGAETPTRNANNVVSGSAPPRVDLVSGPTLSASLTDLTLADGDLNGPTSRFSVTTYDPTEAGSLTPSPRHSLTPSPPASIIDTASQSSETARSIMSRARPVPSAIVSGKRPVRKPIPSDVLSNKELPPNPAEMTAQGRIEMLEAKRNDLVRRRMNINTIIHELTQVIQPSSIAYDMAAREEVKKTVASLNNELAEIKKEEHDIGLKILRAWKKRENEDLYGQSGSLWVKRVTS
ncbi:hypothetical protein BJX76DRAFT_54991 [Aspergillus varians]